jgi:hypothetical protein
MRPKATQASRKKRTNLKGCRGGRRAARHNGDVAFDEEEGADSDGKRQEDRRESSERVKTGVGVWAGKRRERENSSSSSRCSSRMLIEGYELMTGGDRQQRQARDSA